MRAAPRHATPPSLPPRNRSHAGPHMKIAVIGHGMVGHKFLEQLHDLGVPDVQVTILCEEPRAA